MSFGLYIHSSSLFKTPLAYDTYLSFIHVNISYLPILKGGNVCKVASLKERHMSSSLAKTITCWQGPVSIF